MPRGGVRPVAVYLVIFLPAALVLLLVPWGRFAPAFLSSIMVALIIAAITAPFVMMLFARSLRLERHKRKKAEDEASLAYRILDSSSEPVVITDSYANIEYVNPAFCETTGYASEEVLGKNPRIMQSGRQDAGFYRDMWESITTTGQWQGQLWDRKKSGEEYPKLLTINSVRDDGGKVIKYIGVFVDITALKQTEEQIEYLTRHDNLTGLPNRVLFLDLLGLGITYAARRSRGLAVVILSLSGLKHISDSFGHFAADLFIKDFAGWLAGLVREHDTVARLQEDEFGLVIGDIDGSEEVASIVKKINAQLARPFFIRQRYEVFVTAYMGIALYPSDGTGVETLMKNAQVALHQVREAKGKNFQFFDQSMSQKAFEHLSLEANLRRAIKNGEFVIHYQPQVELRGGTIVGMEALIRRKEDEWLVPPSQFIPLAEETGLIIPISEWTLINACNQSKRWQDDGLPPLRLAINVTAGQFFQRTLISTVRDALDQSGLSPESLELELTEQTIIHDAEEAIKMMKALKDMGVYLSIDDFGTGYSSLSYLKRFPLDKLKVDISFTRDIGVDTNSASITQAIIALAHSLNLKAIAEGVENKAQLDFLLEHGCDEIQGYYFSTPLPADSFRALVKSGRRFL
ncbi:MAG: EAL domain-containing protein [Actinomycetota bacterium]|nr:EAL domain-containing protein [Actinomycetota bacterium]